ncbi:MAG: CoB--CoM heterodisulfide reductase iron-sulfur subunit A family protein [Candidatus Cloacimonetes bacterium]|nr:CoB--CoM heterodisulfide reductase iron-sulfur subunit A family protein [Candidatus Cloacimonadota bacterium]
MKRIGVFICHCGVNIKDTVDVEALSEFFMSRDDIVHAEDYMFLCSDPGQKIIKKAIAEHKLDGVVVASCSPTLHESTFQNAIEEAGLNKFQMEVANIREQCSWVHNDKPAGTRKASLIIGASIEKLKLNESLEPTSAPLTRRAMVIGGGIAGIQTALDIADAGYEVVMVEKKPSIGGHMIQLSETFPTLDCSQCILTPKMVQLAKHPNITLHVNSEVKDISGFVGNFKVTVERKAQYVDPDLCNICSDCSTVCPVLVPSEYDEGLGWRRAIYIPFPQAIPASFTLDIDNCLGLSPIACGKCAEKCEANAINYDASPTTFEVEVGAVVVATGYDLYPVENIAEYGYGKYPDVVTSLQFERILSATGPTGGVVRRPSDGAEPKEVVFIQCCGSRDPEHHLSYCSKICCMYSLKHAKLYKHKVHDGQPYIFYIDIRAGGKRYEEFVQQAISEENVLYTRGKVARIFNEGDKMVVFGMDTLTGKKVEIRADMVVLAMAVVPSYGSDELAKTLKAGTDKHGFFNEAHPKLRPVESLQAGLFLAGACQSPKDIPDAVSQASGTAAKVMVLLSSDRILHSPIIATVDDDLCSGCGICIGTCPYGAREMDLLTRVALVNDILCEGCGACIAACPSGAAQQHNLTDDQIANMIRVIALGDE